MRKKGVDLPKPFQAMSVLYNFEEPGWVYGRMITGGVGFKHNFNVNDDWMEKRKAAGTENDW